MSSTKRPDHGDANTANAEARASKRPRFNGPMVTIKAGAEEASFMIHESYIIDGTSDFLHAALTKNWKERQTREIPLPEDPSSIVANYIEWRYTKNVASKAQITDSESAVQDPHVEFDYLAELYIFGDKYQDKDFCAAVVAAMRDLKDRYYRHDGALPGPSTISLIYHHTPKDSDARRFLVRQYDLNGKKDWLDDDEILEIPEFLRDLAVARLPSKPQPRTR